MHPRAPPAHAAEMLGVAMNFNLNQVLKWNEWNGSEAIGNHSHGILLLMAHRLREWLAQSSIKTVVYATDIHTLKFSIFYNAKLN